MPWADYYCPGCPGVIVTDHVFAMAVGARNAAPLCPVCECYMEVIPAAQFDLKTDGEGDREGQKFTIHRQVPTKDGLRQVEEVITSAHAMAQIERDAEQRYRDGEGEPLRFRARHQSASNMDQNSFGTAGQIGTRSYDSGKELDRSGKVGLKRHGQTKPRIPVARGAGRSPL